jgi:inorganic pyrophosphatase
MDISKLEAGTKEKLNVFLKCLKGTKEVYDYNEESGIFVLKKTLNKIFPANYGVVPKTHHVDAERLEVLVLTERPLQQGVVLEVRPIGVIRLRGNLPDDVLVAIPIEDKKHENIQNLSQLNTSVVENLKDFLEEFKQKEVENVFDSDRAKRAVEHSIKLYKKEFE